MRKIIIYSALICSAALLSKNVYADAGAPGHTHTHDHSTIAEEGEDYDTIPEYEKAAEKKPETRRERRKRQKREAIERRKNSRETRKQKSEAAKAYREHLKEHRESRPRY